MPPIDHRDVEVELPDPAEGYNQEIGTRGLHDSSRRGGPGYLAGTDHGPLYRHGGP